MPVKRLPTALRKKVFYLSDLRPVSCFGGAGRGGLSGKLEPGWAEVPMKERIKTMEKLKTFIEAANTLKEDGYEVAWCFNEGTAFLEGKAVSTRRITLDIRKKLPATGEAKEIMELIQS
jgi:hypothetical protein